MFVRSFAIVLYIKYKLETRHLLIHVIHLFTNLLRNYAKNNFEIYVPHVPTIEARITHYTRGIISYQQKLVFVPHIKEFEVLVRH